MRSTTFDSPEPQELILNLKSKIADQEEQIQTLIKRRRDDLEKFKEFERTRLQLNQVCCLGVYFVHLSTPIFSCNHINVKHKNV